MSGASVLFVDDEENNRTVFEAAFEDDFDVRVAASGVEALAVLRTRPAKVLVTDMRMPGMSGVDLLEAVIPEWPDTVRIVLTGYTDIDSVVRAINQGQVYQYVTKPWDEREVRLLLERAIATHDAVMEERRLLAELEAQTRKEEAIRTLFQRYVPESIVDQVLGEQPSTPASRATTRQVAMLFADLRGFTGLCTRHEPPTILRVMNAYFTAMTACITRRRGLVAQYLGDAILAVFGANAEIGDEPAAAVRAALDMVEALERFNERVAMPELGVALSVGVGIQLGAAAVGEVGSADSRVFTVVGDPVHQVMRVEAMSKGTLNGIFVTEAVVAALGDAFVLREGGGVALGERHVPLHRVMGRRAPGGEG